VSNLCFANPFFFILETQAGASVGIHMARHAEERYANNLAHRDNVTPAELGDFANAIHHRANLTVGHKLFISQCGMIFKATLRRI